MRDYVLCGEQKQNGKLIYDCFAVSNHMGGVGGGHYTAYGMNVTDNEWYSFNDSSCSKVNSSRVVSSSAYSLFYRLRGHNDLNNLNFENMALTPDAEYFEHL
jgi:ubiquitin carboxyl-terminal hydrolase 4/11/15